ncbi:hypothetical protein KAR91_02920 [Candidatus Pacearchaeota archaeon]|nr:hypothetical protein [Candidatus Pacearchaeota archaeon]
MKKLLLTMFIALSALFSVSVFAFDTPMTGYQNTPVDLIDFGAQAQNKLTTPLGFKPSTPAADAGSFNILVENKIPDLPKNEGIGFGASLYLVTDRHVPYRWRNHLT